MLARHTNHERGRGLRISPSLPLFPPYHANEVGMAEKISPERSFTSP